MNNRIRWYQIRRVMAVVLIVTLLPFSSFAANGVCVQAAPLTPDENSLGQEVSGNAVVEENVTPNSAASDTVAFENAVPRQIATSSTVW